LKEWQAIVHDIRTSFWEADDIAVGVLSLKLAGALPRSGGAACALSGKK
jgi:hypothetical protein